MVMGRAWEQHIDRPSTGYLAQMYGAARLGSIGDYYESLIIGDDELERGVADGRLVVDNRLRDALRNLRLADGDAAEAGGRFALPAEVPPLVFPLPTLVEEAEYAVEAAVLGEADIVRLQRRLDTLEDRLLSLELRLPARAYRNAARVAKRVLRREPTS
jgi:hypothetical protein